MVTCKGGKGRGKVRKVRGFKVGDGEVLATSRSSPERQVSVVAAGPLSGQTLHDLHLVKVP